MQSTSTSQVSLLLWVRKSARIRRARPHAINLYRPKKDDPVWRFLEPAPLGRGETSDDWFVYLEPAHYDRELLGLTGDTGGLWIA